MATQLDKYDRQEVRKAAISLLSVMITTKEDLKYIISELSLEDETVEIGIEIGTKEKILDLLKTKD